MGLDAQRLMDWAYVHCLISASWALQDGTDPGFRLKVAALIETDVSE